MSLKFNGGGVFNISVTLTCHGLQVVNTGCISMDKTVKNGVNERESWGTL